MNKTRLGSIWILIVVCAQCTSQIRPECQNSPFIACSFTYSQIEEAPKGAANGANHLFILSSMPSSDYWVTVLINDQQMISGRDYSLSRNRLLFNDASTPKQGDTIKVRYPTLVNVSKRSRVANYIAPHRSVERHIQSVDTRQAPTDTLPEEQKYVTQTAQDSVVLKTTLLRAVDQEQSQYHQDMMARIEGLGREPYRTKTPGPNRSHALNLLMNQLETNRRRLNKAVGKDSRDSVAQGVEGLGDFPVATPYDVMLGLSPDVSPIEQFSSGRSLRDITPRSVPRSLRMLADKLDSSTDKNKIGSAGPYD